MLDVDSWLFHGSFEIEPTWILVDDFLPYLVVLTTP